MSPSRKLGASFAVELGLLATVWIVAGLLKAGVEVPGGEVLVLGATPFLVWGLVRAWRAGDPEQRQAVEGYRSWAESRSSTSPTISQALRQRQLRPQD